MTRISLLLALFVFSSCKSENNLAKQGETGEDTASDPGIDTAGGTETGCGGWTSEHGYADADCDGYAWTADCNDSDPAAHPGATEVCGDGVDQNCDGTDLACEDTGDTPPDDTGEETGSGDEYVTVTQAVGTFTVPATATEVNAWMQVQCNDDVSDCPIVETLVKQLSILKGDGGSLLVTDFTSVADLATLQWSGEQAPIGADGMEGDYTPRFAPADFFTIVVGEGVTFATDPGFYSGTFSCNILEECSRPVISGEELSFTGSICRYDDAEGDIQVRFGMDFFETRNGTYVSSIEKAWSAFARNTCLEVVVN